MCSKQFIFNFLVLGLASSFSSKTTKWNLARHNWKGCVRNVRKLLSILDFLLFLIYINRVVPSWGTGRDLLTTQKIVYVPHKLACTSTILPKTQSFAIFMHFLVILIIMWPHQKTHSGKAWCIYIFTILSLMMMLKNIKVLNFT